MTADDRLSELRRRGEAAGVPGCADMTADELSEALGKLAKGVDGHGRHVPATRNVRSGTLVTARAREFGSGGS